MWNLVYKNVDDKVSKIMFTRFDDAIDFMSNHMTVDAFTCGRYVKLYNDIYNDDLNKTEK